MRFGILIAADPFLHTQLSGARKESTFDLHIKRRWGRPESTVIDPESVISVVSAYKLCAKSFMGFKLVIPDASSLSHDLVRKTSIKNRGIDVRFFRWKQVVYH